MAQQLAKERRALLEQLIDDGYSQADIARDLIRAGVTVLCTNQRSLDDIFRTILLIGGALGREGEARAVVQDAR